MTYLKLGDEGYRCSAASIERAFIHHGLVEGDNGWRRHPDGGWLVTTGVGWIRLKTLRDGALFTIGLAEKQRRLDDERVTRES